MIKQVYNFITSLDKLTDKNFNMKLNQLLNI